MDRPQNASLATVTINIKDKPVASSSPPTASLLAEHVLPREDDPSYSKNGFYSSAQWSPDGTCLVASASTNTISSFVLPMNLLEESQQPKQLNPQAHIKLPESARAFCIAPYFTLSEPASQLLLAGCRDHPLHLYNAFPQQNGDAAPIATYKLIRKETEEFITPSSLLWEDTGTHFLCGSTNRLDYFDLSRPGYDGPVLTIPTIPSKRHLIKGGGVGMKGTVSALSASATTSAHGSIVAAGTWTRWMGLYDVHRSAKAVANWSITQADEVQFSTSLGGQGISQTIWSPCGRYLVINERRASGLMVYDIRSTGKLLSLLQGRQSTTQQRLSCDVFQLTSSEAGSGGFEVWAGSQDGQTSVWQDVGARQEVAEPSWSWKAHSAPVGSTILHPSGSVVATCSGAWQHTSDDSVAEHSDTCRHPNDNLESAGESSLRIWKIDESSDA